MIKSNLRQKTLHFWLREKSIRSKRLQVIFRISVQFDIIWNKIGNIIMKNNLFDNKGAIPDCC